ncbi:MAG: SdiA-regulated domain-containing protein [Prochloraceae cyanobacterium]|nr:SdiA-regulated domain-containing protein [Prochloraceae cyanobacterium]
MIGKIPLSLTYLERQKIKNESLGLCEPSGVAMSQAKNELWIVSDDTKKVFKLTSEGKLVKDKSFKIPEKGLEGIVLEPNGKFLLAIKEENNLIIRINIDSEKITDSNKLESMENYNEIAHFFTETQVNKGLEGIAWNQKTGTIFVVKEGNPGLLIEISADLNSIISYELLNEQNGFYDNKLSSEEIDFSGICYDLLRNCFWLVSDRAKRLFLYNWEIKNVIQSFKLGYSQKGEYRKIKKAEGVTIARDSKQLYIVSDLEAMLYVFDVRE